MHFSSLFLAGLSAMSVGLTSASPLAPRWGSGSASFSQSDMEVLAFALNLEHLEVAFYTLGLDTFADSDFAAAGFSPDVRGRFQQILEHEIVHVNTLVNALGPAAPQACNYSFPIHQVADMVAIAFALESTGEAAYMGGVTVLQNQVLKTTAASIQGVEARQSSFLSTLNGRAPWYGIFDTPLNQSQVISLASGFIVTCPSDNFPLAVEPLPALTVTPANDINVGTTVTISIGGPDFSPANFPIIDSNLTSAPNNIAGPPPPGGWFLAYFHGGQNVSFSPIAPDNTTVLPDGLAGAVWAQVVITNSGTPTLDEVVSGVAMLNIPVPADVDNSFN